MVGEFLVQASTAGKADVESEPRTPPPPTTPPAPGALHCHRDRPLPALPQRPGTADAARSLYNRLLPMPRRKEIASTVLCRLSGALVRRAGTSLCMYIFLLGYAESSSFPVPASSFQQRACGCLCAVVL